MKIIVGVAALLMFSSLGVGALLSHGPRLDAIEWSNGSESASDGWGQDIRLTHSYLESKEPVAAQDSEGNLHLVWTDDRTGETDIYYKKVDPAGDELVPDKRLSTSLSKSVYPALALDSSKFLHVAWLDNRGGVWNVYYARLDSEGRVLVANLQITNIQPGSQEGLGGPPALPLDRVGQLSNFFNIEGRRPSIDVDSLGNAHLAWCDFRDGEAAVRYTVISSGGSILTDQARISVTTSNSYNAVVRVRGEEMVVLWSERSGDTSQLFYSRLDPAGQFLVEPRMVAAETSQDMETDAVVDAEGNTRLVWSSDPGLNYDLFYARIDPAGDLLGHRVQITDSRLDSRHPSVRLDSGGNLQLAWSEQDRFERYPVSEIDYARLCPDGAPVGPPQRITSAPFRSLGPALALSGNDQPTVIWSDSRDGPANSELYMKTQYTLVRHVEDGGTLVSARPGDNYIPVAAAAGGLGVLLAVAFTEAGRYKLSLLAVPLYSRLKRESLLNHAVREQIFGYVNNHPGASFSQIMKELRLKNGVLAYHLNTLEREDLIKSMRDGTYRRYYPRSSRSVPFEIQKAILERVEQNPGLSEAGLAELMGISRQVLDYHLNSLIQSGHVRIERRGKRNLCYAVAQVAG